MRKAPEFHHIDDAQVGGGAGMLFHKGHALRQSFARHVEHGFAIEQHTAFVRFAQAREQPQQ